MDTAISIGKLKIIAYRLRILGMENQVCGLRMKYEKYEMGIT